MENARGGEARGGKPPSGGATNEALGEHIKLQTATKTEKKKKQKQNQASTHENAVLLHGKKYLKNIAGIGKGLNCM